MAHHVTFPIFHLNDNGSMSKIFVRRRWTSRAAPADALNPNFGTTGSGDASDSLTSCAAPADPLNPDIETIGPGDASDSLTSCVAPADLLNPGYQNDWTWKC